MRSLRCSCLFLMIIFLASCESNTFLRSKKKLNSDLQGYWCPVPGTSSYGTLAFNNNILWHFQNGEVFIIRVENGIDIPVDNGHYTIDAKIDSDYLIISDFKTPEYLSKGFNLKWDIIDLDKKNLNITGNPGNSGRIQIEFSKTQHY